MWSPKQTATTVALIAQLLSLTTATTSTCKAVPGSADWPSDASWAALNQTLNGRLLKPSPPGAVCHPGQPTYDAATCPSVQSGFLTSIFHTNDPISNILNNWNNDSCIPDPKYTCSGKGYPIYVVNASCPADVKAGIDFARAKNVRLVVKGTGHDYIGRSVAPNALSIWTHHMKSLSFQTSFKPKGCSAAINTNAITAGAGMQMIEIDQAASLKNLTIVGGNAGTVGVGGYMTGGGHSAISSTFGMGADQVLEIEMVTPGGNIITANECQNQDLFWAMRGGGGSTFGVITSLTIKAYPSFPFLTVTAALYAAQGNEAFWTAAAKILAQFPKLDALGISTYSFVSRNFTGLASTTNNSQPVYAFYGIFTLPLLHPNTNSTTSLASAVNETFASVAADLSTNPGISYTIGVPITYDDFYAYYAVNNGPLDGGYDSTLGSRLIDAQSLTHNTTAVAEALRISTPYGLTTSTFLVAGHGVRNATPRGGSNAINPAWRKALIHVVFGVEWPPFDSVAKTALQTLMTGTIVRAMRDLAPHMGAYINESDPNEPEWQEAFWGANYEPLLRIKRAVDPGDVFWCHHCVGNERWEVVGDGLCKV